MRLCLPLSGRWRIICLHINKTRKTKCRPTHHPTTRISALSSPLLSSPLLFLSLYASTHQVADWKGCHKHICKQIAALRDGGKIDKKEALLAGLQKIRLYLCPFAVCKAKQQGPGGFIFAQSPCLATDFHWKRPVNGSGEALSRCFMITHMTMDEFADLCKDDFEMGVARQPLVDAVAECDPLKRVVVLVRTRCGFIGVLDFPLVPDHGICLALGEDYVQHSTLQLNMDDV